MAKTTTIAGNTFLFTGKLTEFTREDAEAHVEAEGGKVLSGVSAKLNYLVVGEDAGSKLAKAEALGTVTILHEKEFLKMMHSGSKKSVSPKKAVPKKAAPKKSAPAKSKSSKEINDFGNMPFAFLNEAQFKKIYGELMADYNDYARIILAVSSTSDNLKNHKKIIFDKLNFENSDNENFQDVNIAPYHFAAATDEDGFDDDVILWVYYHSKSEFGYSNDIFRELSGEVGANVKAMDPDHIIFQGYSNGDFDTGMYYAQNEGDFGMWNAWEDFDPDSDSNKAYSEEFKSRIKASPIKIEKKKK